MLLTQWSKMRYRHARSPACLRPQPEETVRRLVTVFNSVMPRFVRAPALGLHEPWQASM